MSEEKIVEPLYYNGYISLDERSILRDYIEQLQQENQQLKEYCCKRNAVVINNAEIGVQVQAIINYCKKCIDERDKYKQQLKQKNNIIEELNDYLSKGYLINTKDIKNILNKGSDK